MHYGIAIELRADCQKCGQPVHVNALVNEVRCTGCQSMLTLTGERWKGLLEDAFDEIPDYEIGRGGRSQSFSGEGNTNILYAHFNPYCFDCKTDFDMSQVANAVANGADAVECSKCHKHWHVRVPPGELDGILPGVELLIAEDEKLIPGGAAHDGEAPGGGKPLVFQCPSCSGALRVDGSDRVIDCQYCNASVYLPDDLWFRLHPRDTVRRWFLWWLSPRERDASRFPVEVEDSDDSLPTADDDLVVEPAPMLEPESSALVPTPSSTPARVTPGVTAAAALTLGLLAAIIGALVVLLL